LDTQLLIHPRAAQKKYSILPIFPRKSKKNGPFTEYLAAGEKTTILFSDKYAGYPQIMWKSAQKSCRKPCAQNCEKNAL
jgi:hypothetical protein